MAFQSILFESPEDGQRGEVPEPAFFSDLNLDQFVSAATRGYDEYDLTPFFRIELVRIEAIRYRHAVMRDLDTDAVRDSITAFSGGMRKMREHLAQAQKLYYELQRAWWFLEAAGLYCRTLSTFARELHRAAPLSSGLVGFSGFLAEYTSAEPFQRLLRESNEISESLGEIRYCMVIKGNAVTVLDYASQSDYSAEVLRIFEKFEQGAVKDHSVELRDSPQMNHVEAQVLQFVAQLNPEEFSKLAAFRMAHANYLDTTIAQFDREIQFYLAYRGYIEVCQRAGLAFCYPRVSASKAVRCDDTFDLVLAHKLATEKAPVVCNDFRLDDGERLFVVSGPNNGGKTTFARTFGQLHFLARLGCPVPGRHAQLLLYDQLFTHFEREENTKDLRGKLQDDLVRVHHILEQATSRSIILMNEIFSSTTLTDALFLGKKVIGEILKRGALCVCVTFIEELARLSSQAVSMVSETDPGDPALRTYRVKRLPADGRAYAMSVAGQYRLTYDHLKERLGL